MLNEVEISRPAHLGGEKWRLSNLTRITVLFGKNGSGRSSLLRAWRDVDFKSAHYIVPERGGNLNFEPNLAREESNAQKRQQTTDGRHVFRHSFCSNCAAVGIDQRIINAWVGHQTEEMVRRYRHLIPNQEQAAIRQVFGE